MKKILSIVLTAVTLLSMLMLAGCKKDDAPKDMRLVMGGSDLGYYFYGPEEWVVANYGSIACTYASKIDTTSMTFAETEKPDGTVEEYFNGEKDKFPYEIAVKKNEGSDKEFELVPFGDADKRAHKYTYTYNYNGFSYTCMQIFVEHGDRFFIFTYTGSNEKKSNDETYYEFYLEKVSDVIENFKFTDRVPGVAEEGNYEEKDGYILISDKSIAGFNMYVPKDYRIDHSSVLVGATSADRSASITMSTATYTGVTYTDYIVKRMTDLNVIVDKTDKNDYSTTTLMKKTVKTDETGAEVTEWEPVCSKKEGSEELEYSTNWVIESLDIKGVQWARAYEYTYSLEGIKYHVYQVLIVEGTTNGYVFTYTAAEDKYEASLEIAKTILEKIEY